MKRHKKIIMPGQRFGMLTVEGMCLTPYIAPNGHTRRQFWCVCDCGNRIITNSHALKMGNRLSCGCMRRAKTKPQHPRQQRKKPDFCIEARKIYRRLSNIWRLMKERCYNSNALNYKNYGARGISICDQWLNDRDSFIFWAIAHGYGQDKSIDRINNDMGYSPENCRWVDWATQCNNKRCCHYIEYGDECMTVKQWERRLGLSRGTIKWRLANGWTPRQAIEGR